MTATSRRITTELSGSSSLGTPGHAHSMSPSNHEEDEWLEHELERARSQRGTFYKKLTNSRTSAARELEEQSAARAAARSRASRASSERSRSPTSLAVSPTPGGGVIPEPHCSWRFYTSFDDGEWKRHMVPVKKEEEEIMTPPSGSKVTPPTYESHLKKYREARTNMFDRSARRFGASGATSPEEQQKHVTTVMTSGGGGPAGTVVRRITTGVPFGHQDAPHMQYATRCAEGITPDMMFYPLSSYREESSKVVTTVEDGRRPKKVEAKAVIQSPASLLALESVQARLKNQHLGYKEKILVPTKYKTEEEKAEAAVTQAAATAEKAKEEEIMKEEEKKRKEMIAQLMDAGKPSYLGSTFEKFNYVGLAQVKPEEVVRKREVSRRVAEVNGFHPSSPQRPEFDTPTPVPDSKPGRTVLHHLPKRKPVFDMPPVNQSVSQSCHEKENYKPNFSQSGDEVRAVTSPFQSSTPTKDHFKRVEDQSFFGAGSSRPWDTPERAHRSEGTETERGYRSEGRDTAASGHWQSTSTPTSPGFASAPPSHDWSSSRGQTDRDSSEVTRLNSGKDRDGVIIIPVVHVVGSGQQNTSVSRLNASGAANIGQKELGHTPSKLPPFDNTEASFRTSDGDDARLKKTGEPNESVGNLSTDSTRSRRVRPVFPAGEEPRSSGDHDLYGTLRDHDQYGTPRGHELYGTPGDPAGALGGCGERTVIAQHRVSVPVVHCSASPDKRWAGEQRKDNDDAWVVEKAL